MAGLGVIVAVVAVAGIIGFMFVNGALEFNQENLTESVKDLPENLKESIQNIQESIPEIPIDTSSIIPPKSKLIGYSHTLDKVVFTVLDVRYVESSSKYTKLVIIEIKADNQDNINKLFNQNLFYLLDQNLIKYNGKIKSSTLKPSIPQDFILTFEIPKDDSLSFSLHLPVSAVAFSRGSVNIGVI